MAKITIDELREVLPFLTEEDVSGIRKLLFNHPSLEAAVAEATRASNMRAPNMIEVLRESPMRVLASSADVNALVDGTEVFAGASRATVLDLLGATGYRDKHDRNVLRIWPSGGGADCMFNAIASKCWATEVAAGRGIEGQSFTSLTGCTFKVYSTVQGAIDGRPGDDVSKWVILVCAGDYAEDVVLNDATKLIPDIHGVGYNNTIIQSVTVTAVEGGGNRDTSIWKNLTIRGNGTLLFSSATGTLSRVTFENVWFSDATSSPKGGTITMTELDVAVFTNCHFRASPTVTGSRIIFDGCVLHPSTELSIGGTSSNVITVDGCIFDDAMLAVQDFSAMSITGCIFDYTLTHDHSIKLSVAAGTLSVRGTITGNAFVGAPTTAYIYIDSWASTGAREALTITGNAFKGDTYAATTRILLSDDTDVNNVVFAHNTMAADTTPEYIEDVSGFTVSGNFSNSVFGPNAPANIVRYSITGTNNLFIPASSMSGSGSTTVPPITPRYNLYETAGQYDSWLEGAALTPAVGALTLGTDGDMFHVAAGNFASIGTPTRQALALLIFDGVSVLTHGANLILQGAANFTSAAGDTMLLAWEGGTVWREINRSLTAGAGILGPVQAPVTKTISAGAITLDAGQYVYKFATEGSASSDDLDTINGLEDDRLYIFQNDGTGDTVRLRIAVDNIKAVQQVSYLYLNSQTVWCLGYVEDNSIEIGRASCRERV